MSNVTVKLATPIEAHEGQLTSVTLREPKYSDMMALGEPASYARSDSGLIYTADNDDVIRAYIERLLVEPKDPALLMQLTLADTLQLRDAIFGFFQAARKAISPQ